MSLGIKVSKFPIYSCLDVCMYGSLCPVSNIKPPDLWRGTIGIALILINGALSLRDTNPLNIYLT